MYLARSFNNPACTGSYRLLDHPCVHLDHIISREYVQKASYKMHVCMCQLRDLKVIGEYHQVHKLWISRCLCKHLGSKSELARQICSEQLDRGGR